MSYLGVLANISAGVSVAEIARRMGISKQATSQVVNRLETEGYICTTTDEKDARASRIFLTERGTRLLEDAFSGLQLVQEEFYSVVGHGAYEQMIDTLVKLVDHVDKKMNMETTTNKEQQS